MGNRGIGTDWPIAAFQLITGTAEGIFPAATVVQSAQLYNFKRDSSSPCRIQTASIRLSNIYAYLTQALKNGTQLVIRITPSPGNFKDYNNPGDHHELLPDQTPAGGNYCEPTQPGELSQVDKVNHYRDIRDIVQEMVAIQQLNDKNGWKREQIFFEPANEPNNEWYTTIRDKLRDANPKADLVPYVDNKTAWIEMDNYFAELYDLAHQLNAQLQILTPPMGQENWSEHYGLHTCHVQGVWDEDSPIHDKSGYDFMSRTYGQGRFAGFSWHNYWIAGEEHEKWDEKTIINCQFNSDDLPPTEHVYQYFSDSMQKYIINSNKPTFITEADLYSFCHKPDQPIRSKVLYPTSTQLSLQRFFAEERAAQYVINWLLVQEDDGRSGCSTINPQSGKPESDVNYEMAWHEAFQDKSNTYYDWFRLWWLGHE